MTTYLSFFVFEPLACQVRNSRDDLSHLKVFKAF